MRPAPAYFHDLTFSYSHLDYPLLFPFLTAGAYAATGTTADRTAEVISIFLDVLTVPMLYLGLRWKLPRLPAICLSAVPILLPITFRLAGSGCADLPLAAFYAGSVLYAARWIDEGQREDLVLAILFSVFVAFTKNEGLVLALINGVVMGAFAIRSRPRSGWTGAAIFFGGLLLLDGPWLIWNHSLPRTHEDYGTKLLSPLVLTNLGRLANVLPAMITKSAEFKTWGLLWFLLGSMALIGWRAFGRRFVQAVWIMLALQLAAYALVYCVTPWNLDELMAISLDRLLWHTVPAVVLLIGWHWAELLAGRRLADGPQ